MPLNTDGLQLAASAIASGITHLSLHTDTDTSSSANETTAARVADGATASNGTVTATNVTFTGGAASGPVRRVGYWSAATGGTFYGSDLLTGDQAFNAAGEYTVTNVTISGSSS